MNRCIVVYLHQCINIGIVNGFDVMLIPSSCQECILVYNYPQMVSLIGILFNNWLYYEYLCTSKAINFSTQVSVKKHICANSSSLFSSYLNTQVGHLKKTGRRKYFSVFSGTKYPYRSCNHVPRLCIFFLAFMYTEVITRVPQKKTVRSLTCIRQK